MKKILALVVAFALCFTAIGGCLTTFAADAAADAALAVNAPDDLVAFNAGTVAVVVSGTGYAAYAAQELKVTFPEALTLKSIDGIDEFDAVGQANYKVATADGVTTVTLVQETPGDTFELTFNLGVPSNMSGKLYNYTVTASAEVGTDANDPVLYTVAEASDSFDVDCAHGATKLTSDATGHWKECNCSVDSCEVRTETEAHTFGEDNICTVCGYVKVEEPEEPEVCEHVAGDPVEENRVEATPGVAGSYDSVVYCTLCNEELSRTPVEIPALAPATDSNITFRDSTLIIGACLELRIRVTKNTIDSSKYSSFDFVVVPTKYDTTQGNEYNEITPDPIVLTNEPTNNYNVYWYKDVAMYELGLDLQYYVRCYNADGKMIATSEVQTFNPSESLLATYNAATSDMKDLKTVIADLLNMGTYAQKFFGTSYSSSHLNAAVKEGKLVNIGIDQADASTSYNELVPVNETTWGAENPLDPSVNRMAISLLASKAPTISYRIYKGTSLDKDKMALNISYTSNNGQKEDFTVTGNDMYVVGTSLYYDCAQLAYYDSNVTVTTTFTYDGKEVWTNIYSVDTGVKANMESTSSTKELLDLLDAIAKFGCSARVYTKYGA